MALSDIVRKGRTGTTVGRLGYLYERLKTIQSSQREIEERVRGIESLDDICKAVLVKAKTVFSNGFEEYPDFRYALFLENGNGANYYRLKAQEGYSASDFPNGNFEEFKIRKGEGVTSQVWSDGITRIVDVEHKKTLKIKGYGNYEKDKYRFKPISSNIKFNICVAIKDETDRVIGVLNVESPNIPNKLYYEDIEELEHFAGQIGAAYSAKKRNIFDPLTGLYNKEYGSRQYSNIAERALGLKGSSPHDISLLFIDIDHFSAFNDLYGQRIGDEVLRIFGNGLREVVRDTDIVYRDGGEEFVSVLDRTKKEVAVKIAKRYMRQLKGIDYKPLWELVDVEEVFRNLRNIAKKSDEKKRKIIDAFGLDIDNLLEDYYGSTEEKQRAIETLRNSFRITASIGVANYLLDLKEEINENSPQKLYDIANNAKMHVKNKGRNGIAIYNPETGNYNLIRR